MDSVPVVPGIQIESSSEASSDSAEEFPSRATINQMAAEHKPLRREARPRIYNDTTPAPEELIRLINIFCEEPSMIKWRALGLQAQAYFTKAAKVMIGKGVGNQSVAMWVLGYKATPPSLKDLMYASLSAEAKDAYRYRSEEDPEVAQVLADLRKRAMPSKARLMRALEGLKGLPHNLDTYDWRHSTNFPRAVLNRDHNRVRLLLAAHASFRKNEERFHPEILWPPVINLRTRPVIYGSSDPYSGMTPLVIAIANDDSEMVRILLENGADPNLPILNQLVSRGDEYDVADHLGDSEEEQHYYLIAEKEEWGEIKPIFLLGCLGFSFAYDEAPWYDSQGNAGEYGHVLHFTAYEANQKRPPSREVLEILNLLVKFGADLDVRVRIEEQWYYGGQDTPLSRFDYEAGKWEIWAANTVNPLDLALQQCPGLVQPLLDLGAHPHWTKKDEELKWVDDWMEDHVQQLLKGDGQRPQWDRDNFYGKLLIWPKD